MDPRAGRGAARRRWTCARSGSSPRCAGRVVLVPQEGFLFDDTLRANVRYGRLDATDEEILASAAELGLADWLDGLPRGLDTRVGQRGESLSAGERQLVALLRAHLADPDLLVLDEATSAVDPDLEMRIGRRPRAADARPHVGHHRAPDVAPPRTPTRSSSSTAAASSSAARTPRWSSRTACTPGCTGPGSPSRAASDGSRASVSRGLRHIAARPRMWQAGSRRVLELACSGVGAIPSRR